MAKFTTKEIKRRIESKLDEAISQQGQSQSTNVLKSALKPDVKR